MKTSTIAIILLLSVCTAYVVAISDNRYSILLCHDTKHLLQFVATKSTWRRTNVLLTKFVLVNGLLLKFDLANEAMTNLKLMTTASE
jgi:hypothetical protein